MRVVFFRDARGRAPVLDWLNDLRKRDRKAFAKCVARIQRLAELGYELRRPEADYLRDGIWELRARRGTVNYRVLYFLHGAATCVLAHALTKKASVPDRDIERARSRKALFEEDPKEHTHEEQ
jgi:phage-related protein